MSPKNILLAMFVLLTCQAVDFIVAKFYSFSLNDQLFFGSWLGNYAAILISLIAVAATFLFIVRMSTIPAVIFMAAGLSNIIDRILYRGVVDYLQLWKIPTFNLADLLVCFSLGASLIMIFWLEIKKTPSY